MPLCGLAWTVRTKWCLEKLYESGFVRHDITVNTYVKVTVSDEKTTYYFTPAADFPTWSRGVIKSALYDRPWVQHGARNGLGPTARIIENNVRARAFVLLKIGHRLSLRWRSCEPVGAFVEIWVDQIMPRVLPFM